MQYTLYIIQCTLYKAQCILYRVHCKLCNVQCTLCTYNHRAKIDIDLLVNYWVIKVLLITTRVMCQSTMHYICVHCSLYNIQCTVYIVICTVYSIHCTMASEYGTLAINIWLIASVHVYTCVVNTPVWLVCDIIHCTQHNGLHCTVFNIQCTMVGDTIQYISIWHITPVKVNINRPLIKL